MIWFDYLALGILAYFGIKGFLSGFVRTIASFIGIIVAFLYAGWLSIKIAPFIGDLTTHNPKVLPILSYVISFILIYFTFIITGFLVVSLLGKLNLSLADRILGGMLGFIKGCFFITFFFLVLVIPYPAAQNQLKKALTYPLVEKTFHLTSPLLPDSWKSFLKSRGISI